MEQLLRESPHLAEPHALLVTVLGISTTAAKAVLKLGDGNLRELRTRPLADFEHVKGVGKRHAPRIVALLELLARYADEQYQHGVPLRGPRDVATYFGPRLQDLPVEEFHIAVLDAQHRLHRDVLITRGVLNSSLVHPREVYREAIAERAAAVILVHNHPSGDTTPSAEDRHITEQLVAAGRLLDIPVHDHVIIGKGKYLSFAEAGLL